MERERLAIANHSENAEPVQREAFAVAVESVTDGVILLDSQGRITYLNPSAESITGQPAAEMIGKPLTRALSIVHDDTGLPIENPFNTVRQRGERVRFSFNTAIVTRSGSQVPVECSATPLRDAQRRFNGAVVVFRDVRRRRAAERALQSSEESRVENAEALFEEKERAQVTLNSIGDAVVSTNFWGRVTYLNVVAERMTGWSQGEASGRAVDDVFRLIDAATRTQIPNPTVRAIIEDTTVGVGSDCMLIRRDGIEVAVETSAAPIHDRHGGVIGSVMVAHDVTTARELSHKLARLALHDTLTDVPNRTLLNDRLDQAIMRAQRSGTSVALLFVDLDRFKHINDSLGHAVGDELLKSVARRLLGCVRSSDTVSRQGGDEFLILLEEITQPHDAAVCAEKIISALDAPHRIGEHDLHVTASVGIATFPGDAQDTDTLLRNADFAMYQAKYTGRNNYQFFKPEMNANAMERQSVEMELRQAIERQEFVLNYQPKVNLTTGTIVGVEALIRWHRPMRGIIPPGQFIPIAEESGLILPIGRWALEKACRQARAWQESGQAPMSVAINVSAVELRAKDFLANVRRILQSSRLEPRFLEIELTETFMMQDWKSTAEVLKALKSLGVRIALDDFGTGYSSLSYMKRFPIDALKIDQSFVRDMTTDMDDASIVSAVIDMGRSLHMRVIAEGIQTHDQLLFLQDRQCPEGQGFFFGPPVPASQLTDFLSRHGTEHSLSDWVQTRSAGGR
ncbi:MAG TPA: EAL domain-containing protein [Steroidobacteraceae bacterium]|nr:EAL domain-containing protein [Steroidobacteraceae bacterium]